MKLRTRFVWGIGLLLVAVLLILNLFGITLGLPAGTSLWRVLLSALCLTWMANELVRLRIPGIFFPLAFAYYFLMAEINGLLGITTEVSIWLLMLIALLLSIGSAMLMPRYWYTKRIRKVKDDIKGTVNHATNGKMPGGRNVCYVDCSEVFHETVENNLGLCEIFFTNVLRYPGGGTVSIENNLGRLVLHVPKDWVVVPAIENSMGSVSVPHKESTENAKVLHLTGENNLGSMEVVYEG